jgi:hypothetical protein
VLRLREHLGVLAHTIFQSSPIKDFRLSFGVFGARAPLLIQTHTLSCTDTHLHMFLSGQWESFPDVANPHRGLEPLWACLLAFLLLHFLRTLPCPLSHPERGTMLLLIVSSPRIVIAGGVRLPSS